MPKITRVRIFVVVTLSTFLIILIPYVLIRFQSDSLANFALANAIGPEDFELPQTAYSAPNSSDDIHVVGGQGSGLSCSLPGGIDDLAFARDKTTTSPISLRIRQACVFHDYCYRHGNATYDYTQADCDILLQEHTFRLCTQINKKKSIERCETDARKISLAVLTLAASNFRRAKTTDNEPHSTYFEFDPYPIRSKKYKSFRISDTPQAWIDLGATNRSLYEFAVRQSGTRLRIIGFLRNGKNLCTTLDLPGSYEAIETPPMVVHQANTKLDWLVWARRGDLNNTSFKFFGLSTRYANIDDYKKIFGEINLNKENGNCDDEIFLDDHKRDATRATSFKTTGWKKAPPNVDPSVSEFRPIPRIFLQSTDSSLHLLGLTTYPCLSKDVDLSTCIARVTIDPAKEESNVARLSVRDPNCDKQQDKKVDCDRYRNFVTNPTVVVQEGSIGLAWLRRGNSIGEQYASSAFVRWAPAPSLEHTESIDKKRSTNVSVEIPGLSEMHEPISWFKNSDQAAGLLSIQIKYPFIERWPFNYIYKDKITITMFRYDPNLNKSIKSDFMELEKLDRTWISRPYIALSSGSIVFIKLEPKYSMHSNDRCKKIDVDMGIAFFDPSMKTPHLEIRRFDKILQFNVRPINRESDAKFTLSADSCEKADNIEYGRGREKGDELRLARQALNTTPVLIGDLDGNSNEILVPHPLSPSRAVRIKKASTGDGFSWQVVGNTNAP